MRAFMRLRRRQVSLKICLWLFFALFSGEYIVSTVDTTQCVERGSVKIKVVDRPVKVEQDLRLAGRTLAVRVLGENGRPLAGVDVHLFSKKTIPVRLII